MVENIEIKLWAGNESLRTVRDISELRASDKGA
jgi:hypothetical protein